MTERYCDELVAEMENFGQWSDGTNSVSFSIFVRLACNNSGSLNATFGTFPHKVCC